MISSLAVALAGEIIPQSIMPLYVLEFGGACIWFVKVTMWLLAPIAFPLAYVLRLFKAWRTRGKPNKLDGLLQMNELVEFIRLHEQREKHGGMLVNEAGLMARTFVENHEGTIGQNIRPFAAVRILRATSLISPTILGNIKSWAVSYLLVVRSGTIENRATQQDDVEVDAPISISDLMGVLLVKVHVLKNLCSLSFLSPLHRSWSVPMCAGIWITLKPSVIFPYAKFPLSSRTVRYIGS